MTGACAECGAALPQGEDCISRFNAMLALENEFINGAATDGGRGKLAHFHAVSSYVLQHPGSMQYTQQALEALRRDLRNILDGRATLDETLKRTRRDADGATRITRREGDAVPSWLIAWPMTVADALGGDAAGYPGRVSNWAASVIRALDASDQQRPQ